MNRLAHLFRGPLFRFVVLLLAVYGAVALTIDAPLFILVLNDLVMSAAAGVCIAYAPILPGALTSRVPAKGHYLGVGIWLVAASVLLLRMISVVARDLGHPWIYNGNAVTFALLLSLMGALLHLWATNAADGSIPPARWRSTGIVVAVGLFVSLGCWSAHLALTHPASVELR